MKNKMILLTVLGLLSTPAFAETAIFKVLKNDPKNYTEESVRMKTTQGELIIYSVNMIPKHFLIFKYLKKGQCFTLTTDGKLKKINGQYSIQNFKSIKNSTCPTFKA